MLKNTFVTTDNHIWAQRKMVAALLPHLKLRWHGIGVLQGYIHESSNNGPELRVHIWSRKLMLPGIAQSGNAHNHRFTLISTLLFGSLLHTEWQVSEGSGFALYDFVHARLQTEDTKAEMRRLPGEVAVRKVTMPLTAGYIYTFDRGAYHDSLPTSDIVITLVEKLHQREERARVIAPVDMPPVPSFGKGAPDQKLVAGIIDQALAVLRMEP